jgi:hypothetical protein
LELTDDRASGTNSSAAAFGSSAIYDDVGGARRPFQRGTRWPSRPSHAFGPQRLRELGWQMDAH